MSDAKPKGGCLKTLIKVALAGFLLLALLGGFVYWTVKKAMVTDSSEIITLFQEAVPGATVPKDYEGLIAFDRRTGPLSEATLRTTVAKTQPAPEDSWLDRIKANSDETMTFETYSFIPDEKLDFDLWNWKFRNTQLPDAVKTENIVMSVGGQETRCQRLTLEDSSELLLFCIPGETLQTFLMIESNAKNRDKTMIDSFLAGLKPVQQREGWPPAPEAEKPATPTALSSPLEAGGAAEATPLATQSP